MTASKTGSRPQLRLNKRKITEEHRIILRRLVSELGTKRAPVALGLGADTIDNLASGGFVMVRTAERAEAAIDRLSEIEPPSADEAAQ